jgi:predicted site-specific integrase-resolvase
MPNDEGLMYPAEVADVFRVDPKTVSRWADRGRFPALDDGRPGALKTPGGHWRFRPESVDAVLRGESGDAA